METILVAKEEEWALVNNFSIAIGSRLSQTKWKVSCIAMETILVAKEEESVLVNNFRIAIGSRLSCIALETILVAREEQCVLVSNCSIAIGSQLRQKKWANVMATIHAVEVLGVQGVKRFQWKLIAGGHASHGARVTLLDWARSVPGASVLVAPNVISPARLPPRQLPPPAQQHPLQRRRRCSVLAMTRDAKVRMKMNAQD